MHYKDFITLNNNSIYKIVSDLLNEFRENLTKQINQTIIDLLKTKEEFSCYKKRHNDFIVKYHLHYYEIGGCHSGLREIDLLPGRVIKQLQFIKDGWSYPNEVLNNIDCKVGLDLVKYNINVVYISKKSLDFEIDNTFSIGAVSSLKSHDKLPTDLLTEEEKEELLPTVLEYFKLSYFSLVWKILYNNLNKNKINLLEYIKENLSDFYNFIIDNLNINQTPLEIEIFNEFNQLEYFNKNK